MDQKLHKTHILSLKKNLRPLQQYFWSILTVFPNWVRLLALVPGQCTVER